MLIPRRQKLLVMSLRCEAKARASRRIEVKFSSFFFATICVCAASCRIVLPKRDQESASLAGARVPVLGVLLLMFTIVTRVMLQNSKYDRDQPQ